MAKRILIVEDHQDALSILVLIVRSLGYEAMEATTGAEVIEKASFQNPNLVVMDMSLPDMTGVEAARSIKKNPSTAAGLPIIAYSAWSTRTWMEQAASAGIAAYLIKPVPMSLMKQTIEKFVLP